MPKKQNPDPFAPGFEADLNLAKRPAHAQALGELCADWALMELRMFAVFASLTGAPLLMSRALFYSLHTTRARADMLSTLAATVLGAPGKDDDAHPVSHLRKLLKAINRSAAKRNAYVHDAWVSPTNDAAATAQIRLSGEESHGEVEQINSADLMQLANQARIHADNLVKWIAGVDPSLPALLEKHRGQTALELALKRRDFPRETKLEVQKHQLRSS